MCVTSEAYLYVWPPQNQSCLEISREGIDIVRVLIQESPDRFQRTLMRLLMAHASSLWGLERIEESLQPSLEAVELCRKSASVDQQRYGPDLATALQRLAYKLRAGLRFEETVAVAREGVALRRQILDNDAARSSTNVSSLASVLSLYGAYLTVAGRKEEAPAPLKEATEISRQLAASDFREHGRLLASSLTKFACNLSACQKHEEAIRLLAEAIDLIHQGSGDDALDPRLPTPLWALASSLTKLGRAEEGVVPAQEGLAISRNLLKLNPFFKFAVAWALNILTATFNACQRYSEAAPLGKEAIVLYRELAEKNPSLWEKSLGDSEALHDRFYPSDSDLAHSLYTYSVSLAGMGEHDAALKEAKEAVVVLRKMIEKFPDKFQAKLADAVKLVGELEASEKL
ncbi:hypothetical protein FA15DRAFT_761408 [Coprinopsis marcescibilis]|uniref:TPR-like protein n=1 Tax=Coprinopsis marcescibilis TaxID=230819 RepID=A0A5C3K9A9_COPMA|nr:hypothetical protein FA15DRAFT_761408 [Coprinopsis marcescibilis]